MNVFTHELKMYRKSTLMWAFSLSLLTIIMLLMYPTFSKEADAFRNILAGMPKPVRDAMGLQLETFFSFNGFFAYIFTYVLLCGGIQAMTLGMGIIVKETREKTADFLLTKPRSRKQIIGAKIMASVGCIVLTNAIYLIVASIAIQAIHITGVDWEGFHLLNLTLLFVQLIFLSIGVWMAVLLPRIKSVLSVSLAIVFAFFFLQLFGSIIGEEYIRYVIPFQYFQSNYIFTYHHYEWSFFILSCVVIVASVVSSVIIDSKRDVHTT